MKLDINMLANESLLEPFDPLLAARVHSATQLKRRMTGKKGVVFIHNGTQDMLNQYRHVENIDPERLLTTEWPDVLWDDMGVFQEPLSSLEKIPHEVFRTIRALRGKSVRLTRELLDEAAGLGRPALEKFPAPETVRKEWLKDCWSPMITTTILERFFKHRLLSNISVKTDSETPTILTVAEALQETYALIGEKLKIEELK